MRAFAAYSICRLDWPARLGDGPSSLQPLVSIKALVSVKP